MRVRVRTPLPAPPVPTSPRFRGARYRRLAHRRWERRRAVGSAGEGQVWPGVVPVLAFTLRGGRRPSRSASTPRRLAAARPGPRCGTRLPRGGSRPRRDRPRPAPLPRRPASAAGRCTAFSAWAMTVVATTERTTVRPMAFSCSIHRPPPPMRPLRLVLRFGFASGVAKMPVDQGAHRAADAVHAEGVQRVVVVEERSSAWCRPGTERRRPACRSGPRREAHETGGRRDDHEPADRARAEARGPSACPC